MNRIEVLNCHCCGAAPEVRNDGGFVTVYHESDDCWVEAESVSLCEWNRRMNQPLIAKPNPALENVLAKLRDTFSRRQEFKDHCRIVDDLAIGDLRRWVESEKLNGVKNGWYAGSGGKALVQDGIIVALNPSIPEADKGIIGRPINLSAGSFWKYIGEKSEKQKETA